MGTGPHTAACEKAVTLGHLPWDQNTILITVASGAVAAGLYYLFVRPARSTGCTAQDTATTVAIGCATWLLTMGFLWWYRNRASNDVAAQVALSFPLFGLRGAKTTLVTQKDSNDEKRLNIYKHSAVSGNTRLRLQWIDIMDSTAMKLRCELWVKLNPSVDKNSELAMVTEEAKLIVEAATADDADDAAADNDNQSNALGKGVVRRTGARTYEQHHGAKRRDIIYQGALSTALCVYMAPVPWGTPDAKALLNNTSVSPLSDKTIRRAHIITRGIASQADDPKAWWQLSRGVQLALAGMCTIWGPKTKDNDGWENLHITSGSETARQTIDELRNAIHRDQRNERPTITLGNDDAYLLEMCLRTSIIDDETGGGWFGADTDVRNRLQSTWRIAPPVEIKIPSTNNPSHKQVLRRAAARIARIGERTAIWQDIVKEGCAGCDQSTFITPSAVAQELLDGYYDQDMVNAMRLINISSDKKSAGHGNVYQFLFFMSMLRRSYTDADKNQKLLFQHFKDVTNKHEIRSKIEELADLGVTKALQEEYKNSKHALINYSRFLTTLAHAASSIPYNDLDATAKMLPAWPVIPLQDAVYIEDSHVVYWPYAQPIRMGSGGVTAQVACYAMVETRYKSKAGTEELSRITVFEKRAEPKVAEISPASMMELQGNTVPEGSYGPYEYDGPTYGHFTRGKPGVTGWDGHNLKRKQDDDDTLGEAHDNCVEWMIDKQWKQLTDIQKKEDAVQKAIELDGSAGGKFGLGGLDFQSLIKGVVGTVVASGTVMLGAPYGFAALGAAGVAGTAGAAYAAYNQYNDKQKLSDQNRQQLAEYNQSIMAMLNGDETWFPYISVLTQGLPWAKTYESGKNINEGSVYIKGISRDDLPLVQLSSIGKSRPDEITGIQWQPPAGAAPAAPAPAPAPVSQQLPWPFSSPVASPTPAPAPAPTPAALAPAPAPNPAAPAPAPTPAAPAPAPATAPPCETNAQGNYKETAQELEVPQTSITPQTSILIRSFIDDTSENNAKKVLDRLKIDPCMFKRAFRTPHGNITLTPMQYAAVKGSMEALTVMLDNGADVNSICSKPPDSSDCTGNLSGWTPLKIAVENGKTEIAAFLRGRGGVHEMSQ